MEEKVFDVSALSIDGEWLEIDTANEDFGVLKVKVIPQQFNVVVNYMKEDIARNVMDVVVDWNLFEDGKKIPCDDKNKNRWLPTLSMWKVKNPIHTKKGVMVPNVGAEIINFSQNTENFTKK